MDIRLKTWLYDILNAINEIDSFLEDMPNDFNAYQNDLRTRRAIERNMEIIGEAMNRILLQDQNVNLSNARKIVDTRNRIIHGYDSVSDEIIWSIVTTHLPTLRREVERMLNEE
jgi:uncharacterized protein with HEPN domain